MLHYLLQALFHFCHAVNKISQNPIPLLTQDPAESNPTSNAKLPRIRGEASLNKRGFWLVPGFIRYDYSHEGLQSHETVSLTAFNKNALASHSRAPLGPTRPTILPGQTRLLGWLGWLGSWTTTKPSWAWNSDCLADLLFSALYLKLIWSPLSSCQSHLHCLLKFSALQAVLNCSSGLSWDPEVIPWLTPNRSLNLWPKCNCVSLPQKCV
jgi:hypothetical protein